MKISVGFIRQQQGLREKTSQWNKVDERMEKRGYVNVVNPNCEL
jgi:hypothetical protein